MPNSGKIRSYYLCCEICGTRLGLKGMQPALKYRDEEGNVRYKHRGCSLHSEEETSEQEVSV